MEKQPIPQATSPLATWLSYLEHLHSKTIDLGLARVSEVAQRMAVIKPAPFVFTVAGTNGKGTTCRTLESVLMAAGYKVGVYSSPHLVRYTERVRVQGEELPELAHTTSFAEIEAARGDISLSYFEFGTLSALWLFQQARLDVVILEVGLGGRLDATNIVDADVAVVTSIALDHTDWLGPNRESIGREKAGIFRSGKPAIVGEPDMPLTIAEVASEKGALLLRRGVDWQYDASEQGWSFRDRQGALNDLPLPQVPLPNAATALAALRASGLKVKEQAMRDGIQNAMLPGRFQIISEAPRTILDVAHNPHAAAYLAGRLKTLSKTGRVLAVVGMLHDKDIAGTLANLQAEVDDWYCAPLEGPRGATAEQLLEHLRAGKVYTSVAQAWHAAMADARPEDTVLVCGSFHTVAHVMEEIDAGRTGGK
ncbi:MULTISPECIES: bifunctional tetrahydrofolate synthase/dihydrofolate synthase [Klebsiella]|jgi:dihydrofolate synthase/folylpolyglutamate synthase|uniref:bifunctional tetrahydrofolate synthase/dihydrofolate synthase n=1 Tax=Klebsiella TaxID=570 RepID=UPI00024FD4FB|nr:bifunctional tetrahydrofolate synthase/dihydrofolate synthase [Klebsiella oxytoca]EHS94965.1 folC protein [Klebsiella oxytoca 10-5243]EHT9906763.1 bifunctional tetrahydrofolate synthase/dihydrofolate synthase [Klebsiella oxytoca]EJM1006413.1 bifunctional tetrahydrofolate synthase/dihydrofolate synthase [Klebsiella oxytoca]EKQ7239442.1 bifunctional tetrahydrofolate synthase/dihydrofolate synthase [Klebsiella oxytoca]EKU2380804.1 bifunctional tetrahydrofolate synthase/dihydrofolate synthase [